MIHLKLLEKQEQTKHKSSRLKEVIKIRVLVAHTCDPSYLGGRDQEDCCLKPAQTNSSRDPILKKPITTPPNTQRKQADGVPQHVGPEFKSQYHNK
jgi:hypothetical protein